MANTAAIFKGRRTGLLSADGIVNRNGQINDFNGFVDYCPNGHFEMPGPIIWATYANAAGTAPTTGTGGSPTATFVRTTTNPLRGQGSGLYTKPPSNVQGNGFSIDFLIDRADRGKMISGSLVYEVTSGTYDGGLVPYVVDVTNGTVYACAGGAIPNTGTTPAFNFSFPTSTNSVSYRLCFHQSTTSAVACTLVFDDIRYGVQPQSYGSISTDWTSYTPTGAWTTNTTYTGFWRQVGDTMEVVARAGLTGAPNAANFTLTIPAGYSIDTSKQPNLVSYSNLGTVGMQAAGTSYSTGLVGYTSSNTVDVWAVAAPAGNTHSSLPVSQTNPATFASGDFIQIAFKVPIVGWSSGSVAAQNAAVKPVVLNVGLTSTMGVAANGVVKYDSIVEDPYSIYSTITGLATAPFDGSYSVKVNDLSNTTHVVYISIGGVRSGTIAVASANVVTSGCLDIPLKAGQTIGISSNAATTFTASTAPDYQNRFCMHLVTGNSQVIGQTSPNIVTRTVTATTTATIGDDFILADATAASVTVNLPIPASAAGKVLQVKKIDSSVNTVVLNAGASTIDGTATKTISTQYNSLRVVSNGTTWSIG